MLDESLKNNSLLRAYIEMYKQLPKVHRMTFLKEMLLFNEDLYALFYEVENALEDA